MFSQERGDQVQRLLREINTLQFLQEGSFQQLTRERLARELPLRAQEIRQQIQYLQGVIQQWPQSNEKDQLLQQLEQGILRIP
jgi:hypothetical protein